MPRPQTLEEMTRSLLTLIRHQEGGSLTMTYDEAFDLLLQSLRWAEVKGEGQGLSQASNVIVAHLSTCPARYTPSLRCECGAASKRTEAEART